MACVRMKAPTAHHEASTITGANPPFTLQVYAEAPKSHGADAPLAPARERGSAPAPQAPRAVPREGRLPTVATRRCCCPHSPVAA
eukprot:scaffold107292_cov30-Phaeocystis_antarctica.AAC.3